MLKLDEKDWKPVLLTDIFDSITRGKRLKKADHVSGGIPYVSSTADANGTDGFCGNSDGVRKFRNCLTLANSGSVGSCFYHPHEFVASDHVTALERENASKNEYLALSVLVSRLGEKYNFNREINDLRINRERVAIPVNDSDNPDYTYMGQYVSELQKEKTKQYKAYVENRLTELGDRVDIPELGEKEWSPFYIADIFSDFISPASGGLNHLVKTESGGINYIGATNRNNGVLCYVVADEQTKKKILPGNCIGFIKNGDGSAGYAIYKAEPFVSTNDVIYGYAKWINQYTGLFFVATQDMIEDKYSHGYKRNRKRLERDRVMLPVNETGSPDYAYMEQYSKNMMLRKYQQYLDYLQEQGGRR